MNWEQQSGSLMQAVDKHVLGIVAVDSVLDVIGVDIGVIVGGTVIESCELWERVLRGMVELEEAVGSIASAPLDADVPVVEAKGGGGELGEVPGKTIWGSPPRPDDEVVKAEVILAGTECCKEPV